jgi:hypothetical protein
MRPSFLLNVIIGAAIMTAACAGPSLGTREHENWCLIEKARGRHPKSCDVVYDSISKANKRGTPEWCEVQAALGDEPIECRAYYAQSAAVRRGRYAAAERAAADRDERARQIREVTAKYPRAGCMMHAQDKHRECMSGLSVLGLGQNELTQQHHRQATQQCENRLRLDAMVCVALPEVAPAAPNAEQSGKAILDGDK